jgi:23S rRNA-/tRNA-specific pseudouridylate synthase
VNDDFNTPDDEDDNLGPERTSRQNDTDSREDANLGLGVKECITEFEVLSRSNTEQGQSVALVRLAPKTGRTHQVCMLLPWPCTNPRARTYICCMRTCLVIQ